MQVTPEDLLALMLDAGLERGIVESLDLDAPLRDQGFKSVHLPSLLLAVMEKYDYEIPLDDEPGAMSLRRLAAYLEAKTA